MESLITTQNGQVRLVAGKVTITLDGITKTISSGEQVPASATLFIEEGAQIEIAYDDGSFYSNTEVADSLVNTEALDEIEALQALIASGDDPTLDLPETAAGGANGNEGGSGFISVTRSGDETLATSGFNSDGAFQSEFSIQDTNDENLTDTPSALVNDTSSIDEDGVATGNVLTNDIDSDTNLSVVSFQIEEISYDAGSLIEVEGGTIVINEDGSYIFTPNDNWNGEVPVITYTTNTGATATLTIIVNAVDDPSIVVNDSNTVDEDTVATGNVLDNDSDIDNDLTVVSFEVDGETYTAGTTVELEGGSIVINEDGSYTFTPNNNWNGEVPVITYTTNTGESATLTLEVAPVDDPSIVTNDSNTVDEDTVATGNVLDNDSDIDSELSVISFEVDGETYTAGTTVELEGGSIVINEDGAYTFTPNDDWNGEVPVITYTTNTGSSATLTIAVNAVDDPSIVNNDSNTVDEDTVATGNVLDNDSDIDNDLTVVSFEVDGETYTAGTTVELEGGSIVINEDGAYTFTPNDNWNGEVPVITYTTNTGESATLTLEVTPVIDGAPQVTITTDTNNDAFISNQELNDSNDIAVTIGLEDTGANSGDTLNVNGVEIILSETDIENGYVNLTLPNPGEGQEITVTATITDPAGNTSAPGSDSAVIDTLAEASIDLNQIIIGTDNIINSDEASGSVTLSGTVGGDAQVGDTVTLTLDGSTIITTTVIVLGDGVLGFNTVVDASTLVEGETTTITATVTTTDAAGNSSTASDNESYSVDTSVVDAPIVTILNDINNDELLSRAELTQTDWHDRGEIKISIEIDGEKFEAGGIVTIAIENGDITKDIELQLVNGELQFSDGSPATGFEYENGTISFSEYRPTHDESITVTATQTDAVGNTSSEHSDTATVDITLPTINIDLSAITIGDDNIINSDEASGSVTLSGTVDGDVQIGDTVTLSLDGNIIATVQVIDLGDGVLGFTTSIDASLLTTASSTNITASITVIDSAGNSNTATDSESYSVDLSVVDAPVVTIESDVNNDELLSKSELWGHDGVEVSIAIDGDKFESGGLVTINIANGNSTRTVELELVNGKLQFTDGSPANDYTYDNGVIYLLESKPADDETITVTATQTDVAGNASNQGSDTATVDTSLPLIDIDMITGDNKVTDSEDDSVTISGTTTAETNQIVTVTIVDANSLTIFTGTATVLADGSWSITGIDMSAYPDEAGYTVTANVSDLAGNPAIEATEPFTTEDTTAPIANDDAANINEDATLSVTAANGVLKNDTDLVSNTLNVTAFRTGTEDGSGNIGTVGSTLEGTYGTLTLNTDGSYSYTADQAAANALVEGQVVTETFTYTMSDGNGNTDTAELVITITGTNDAPQVSAAIREVTNEDEAPFTIDLLTNSSDVDTTDNLSVSD
ncbi:retention module-containing protein, partial [Shewanella nanhaiensis]